MLLHPLAQNCNNQHDSTSASPALTSVQAVMLITSSKSAQRVRWILTMSMWHYFPAHKKYGVAKNVTTKKCIRTSESSRVGARRSRVTASTRNNPACEHLSTTSALGRLLTPGAAFATLPLRGALPEQLLSQDISLSQSGSDCATLRGKPGRVTRMHQQRHV